LNIKLPFDLIGEWNATAINA